MEQLPKSYSPKKVEDEIYKLWQESGFFNPDNLPDPQKSTFTITIPPPNVTGVLHMGHALNTVIQDILIRQKRMQGFKTLWVPGIDHAGIATQVKVEKKLEKQGKSRFDLGRKKFIQEVQKWKEKYKKLIFNQLKKLGASCDWSRSRFTMDQKYQKAVGKAFKHYHQKGWIYKGKRVINWCPRCQTSLSDLELTYKEKEGKLWYIRYPLDKDNYITVATTRPETMLGDTAVAVNPKHKKYKKLIDKKVTVPLVNREVPIISDRLVDPKFGTGAVKITPSHDFKDYQIGRKHNLESIQVIDRERKITSNAPRPYQGLSWKEAREKIVENLKEQNLLEKVEPYTFQAPRCDRCKAPIEFIPSKQWFLKMDASQPSPSLKQMAQKAVKQGKVKFYPRRWEKVYLDWLKKVRDWCISRQIWWGHSIPLKGTEDVLDTWFSSALWPFAVLGWPEKTNDLKTFYPTQVLSTDPEIINLWVTRMIFSGLEFTGKAPFSQVYIHSTVLTRDGKRMSKSKGTGIDPMKLIQKYGSDATRFGIAYQIYSRQDLKFVEDNIAMGEKFCNKLWNASRFILLQFKNSPISPQEIEIKIPSSKHLSSEDEKIIKQLIQTTKAVNEYLKDFEFGKAAHQLYDFFWHDFCDRYIETAKHQIEKSSSVKDKKRTLQILTTVLINSLKLLHPFVPFITEELYQKFPIKQKKSCLMIEEWPSEKNNLSSK